MKNADYDDFGRQALRFAGLTGIAVGGAVLAGWALDLPAIKSIEPSLPPMKANAALGFVLLGIAILGLQTKGPGWRWLGQMAAAALLALAGGTTFEHLLDCSLGIDELLFLDPLSDASRLLQPGRMSPLAAVGFLLLAVTILLYRHRLPICSYCQQFCLLVILLAAARSLVGLLYGSSLLYTNLKMPMSLHASAAFVFVCLGLLLSRREFFLARFCDRSVAGSALARRVLAWAIGVPLVLGLCCLQGERLGLYSGSFGVSVLVVLMALVLVVFLVAWSGAMNHIDRERRMATMAAHHFQRAAEHDHLTRLLNRRGFLERGEQLVAQARQHGERLACLVFDLDFFKKINDVHGHGVGDDVLKQFAMILQGGCRQGDVVGRTGGEEFCALLRGAGEEDATKVAEWLRAAIGARPLALSEKPFKVTCSGGVAELRPFHASVHALIDGADAALLVAKQTGRNKVVTASSLEEGDVAKACGGPLRKVPVRELMVPVLASVSLETTVARTAQQLMELNLDSLPVVDASGKVTGFITEQDVMTAMLDRQGGERTIADCHHRSAAVFEETAAAEEIATFFSRSAVQRVVIVRQGIPVGLASRRTLLRWLLNDSLDQRAAMRSLGMTAGTLARRGLDDSIRELAAAVSRLTKLDAGGCSDLVSSSVVSEATRIQESVESLLATCRPRRAEGAGREQLTTGALSIA
jgi:diguanylate cyclase (GGDEF)-like protein